MYCPATINIGFEFLCDYSAKKSLYSSFLHAAEMTFSFPFVVIRVMVDDASKTVLIVQHVLPKFERRDSDGTRNFSPEEYLPAILSWIERNRPDEVIMTLQEPGDETYPSIAKEASQIREWKWIQDHDATDEEAAERLGGEVRDVHRSFALGDEHFSIIYPWMRGLVGSRVLIMGGYREECVFGLNKALEDLDDMTFWPEVLDSLLYPRDVEQAGQALEGEESEK